MATKDAFVIKKLADSTHRVRTHVVLLYHNPILDLRPVNPKTTSSFLRYPRSRPVPSLNTLESFIFE